MRTIGFCRTLLLLAAFVSVLLPNRADAQGSRADYERADSLQRMTRDKVVRVRVRPRWLPDGDRFWYAIVVAQGRHRFYLVDARSGERTDAFDHKQLATALTETTGETVHAGRLPFRSIEFSEEGGAILFNAGTRRWRWHLDESRLEEVGRDDQTLETTVRELPRLQRSERTGAETSLLFVNQTDQPVNLHWIIDVDNLRFYKQIAAGEEHRQHTYAGHTWVVKDEQNENILGIFEAVHFPGTAVIDGTWPPASQERGGNRRGGGWLSRRFDLSPDGKWAGRIEDHNLVLRNRETEEDVVLSTEGTESDPYLQRYYWSPDGKKLVSVQEKQGENHEVHFVESAPDDQLQPKLHTFSYRKPGDRIPQARPRLFNLETLQPIPIAEDLFPNPWRILPIRWSPDSSHFTFLYNERGHQTLRVVSVDAESGDVTALIDETSDTFICYSSKQYLRHVKETEEIIWMSERDGWNHLYLFDGNTGELKNQITQGEWVVRGVERVDDENRQIWFTAGGIRPEQDPYHVHYCRVDFDGSNLVVLTEGDGTHEIEFSPNRETYLDTYSRVDLPPVTKLRRTADGSLICELERADWSDLLETGWQVPERFVTKGRDGETDVYGMIFRPTTFDPTKSYPVIEQIYAGPQSAHVQKHFSSYHGAQTIAELGFVVVRIDGMGTSHRSKAFHDVCWQDLADSGFPDRKLWIRAAAKTHPWMDLTRVGIFGGSAGGQNAMRALIDHGDFYHVAVADCGCHDNRMDKIWWNEQWMGWPIGPHYEESSNVAQAHRLEGKLLLIVGELDRNVDPASTMQVVDALVKADKDFDLLVIPGAGHGAMGTPYGTRRARDFLVRHLLDVEPRWE